MSSRARLFSFLGMLLVVLVIVLVLCTVREGEQEESPLGQPSTLQLPTSLISPVFPMPIMLTPTPVETVLPLPPTGTPLVNQATLQAIRLNRPTATLVSASGFRWPYISPDDWRHWAMWTMGAAAVLAYAAWRLRKK